MKLFRRRRQPANAPTYWNGSVVERIQRDAGVDRDTAAAWFGEMLRFLDLVADSKDFLSPPRSVDVAWHAFILHTRDYESYCRERYGRVIHHQPTGEPDPDAYRRAYEQRSRHREPIDHAIWDAPPGLAAAGLAAGAVVATGADEDDEHDDSGHSGGAATAPADVGGDSDGGGDSGAGGDAGGSSCGGSSCGGGGCGGGGA